MDDERQQGSWWGNLETIHPDEDHEDYIEEQNDGEKRKKLIAVVVVVGVILVLFLGGVTAFTVFSSNKGNGLDTKKEQTQTQKKETSTENAKKKKSAEKSAISVMVTADGAAEDSKASVSISEKGKNGKIVVKDISVAVNDEVKICTLPKLLPGLPYLRNSTSGGRWRSRVNYCLVYRTSETQPDSRDQSDLVNYCLVCGTSETTPASRVRTSSVSYYLVYGTFETERQRVAHRRMVNYYLDYRTSETPKWV